MGLTNAQEARRELWCEALVDVGVGAARRAGMWRRPAGAGGRAGGRSAGAGASLKSRVERSQAVCLKRKATGYCYVSSSWLRCSSDGQQQRRAAAAATSSSSDEQQQQQQQQAALSGSSPNKRLQQHSAPSSTHLAAHAPPKDAVDEGGVGDLGRRLGGQTCDAGLQAAGGGEAGERVIRPMLRAGGLRPRPAACASSLERAGLCVGGCGGGVGGGGGGGGGLLTHARCRALMFVRRQLPTSCIASSRAIKNSWASSWRPRRKLHGREPGGRQAACGVGHGRGATDWAVGPSGRCRQACQGKDVREDRLAGAAGAGRDVQSGQASV